MTIRTDSPAPDAPAWPRATASLRRFLLVFLTLVALVSATSFETLFRLPAHEEGDDAANALQIHQAKSLTELHGNYSRWGFHHPGPAFFYCYALGEAVLHDATGLMPRPRNAHVYTGVLVQLGFYAAAIVLLGRYARWPLLTMALALLLGAWHFAHTERIFFSVWPPDVLLMPFLCFVIACAGLAIGDLLAFPVVIVAGSFLVHGHVAQPLFVLPLFAVAAGLGARRLGLAWRELGRRREVRIGLGLLTLFLLPLALDLVRGRHSNFYDIWLHLKYQTESGQSPWQSVLCYASFFIGQNDPSMFNSLDPSSYDPFRERAWLLGLWVIAGVGVLAWAIVGSRLMFRPAARHAVAPATTRRFGMALLYILIQAGVLTLVWGMRQDGGLTNFNSHFNHTLVHGHGLLVIFLLTSVIPFGSKRVASVLLAAGCLAIAVRVPYLPDTYTRADELATHVRAMLRADPKPDAPKLLIFDTEPGVPHWYEAVTLARQFQLAGVPFHVAPDWRVMFGDDAVLPDDPELLARVSVWKLLARDPETSGRHKLNRVCDVVFPAAPSLAAWPLQIDFSRVKTSPLIFYGFGPSEGEFAWTTAKIAQLKFHAADTSVPLRLTLDAAGLTATGYLEGQDVRVTVNGIQVGKGRFGRDRRTLECDVPAAAWNAREPRTISFEIPHATAPARIANSADRRVLGLRVYHIVLDNLR